MRFLSVVAFMMVLSGCVSTPSLEPKPAWSQIKLNNLLTELGSVLNYVPGPVWADEDRKMIVLKGQEIITFIDTGNFDWFDKLLEGLREGKQARICFGFGGTEGMGTDCFLNVGFYIDESKELGIKSLALDARQYTYTLSSFEDDLVTGYLMKISVDDGNVYTNVTLHRDFRLSTEAETLLLQYFSDNQK